MDKVKVDLQCPFCGYCATLTTGSHRKGIWCPVCKQNLFLRWAGGAQGKLDEKGFYFHAYEPFDIEGLNREFRHDFTEGDDE